MVGAPFFIVLMHAGCMKYSNNKENTCKEHFVQIKCYVLKVNSD